MKDKYYIKDGVNYLINYGGITIFEKDNKDYENIWGLKVEFTDNKNYAQLYDKKTAMRFKWLCPSIELEKYIERGKYRF